MIFKTGSPSWSFNLGDLYAGLKVAALAAAATFVSVFLKLIPGMHFVNQLEPAALTMLLTWVLQLLGNNTSTPVTTV